VPGHCNIECNRIADELALGGYAHGYLQAYPPVETVHTFQQPLEVNLNMPKFWTHMAKLQLEKNINSPTM